MTSQLNDVRCYFSEFSCLIWIKFVCFNYVASVSPVLMFGFLFFHEGYGYALVCGLVFSLGILVNTISNCFFRATIKLWLNSQGSVNYICLRLFFTITTRRNAIVYTYAVRHTIRHFKFLSQCIFDILIFDILIFDIFVYTRTLFPEIKYV